MIDMRIRSTVIVDAYQLISNYNERFSESIDVDDLIHECQNYNYFAEPWESEEELCFSQKDLEKLAIQRNAWTLLHEAGVTDDHVLLYVDY